MASGKAFEGDELENIKDDDIMQQHSAIRAEEAGKSPFICEKEPLSSLAAEYQSGSSILLEKIKVLNEQYAAIRRTRGDWNCFFRSFMFSYLEHLLESQDQTEVDRITANVEKCRKTLQNLGYADFTFEDFFSVSLLEELNYFGEVDCKPGFWQIQLTEESKTVPGCLPTATNITFLSWGLKKRLYTFCKSSAEPMGEESDHVHITALSDALGVPIRVVYLDRSSSMCDASSTGQATTTFSTRSDSLPQLLGSWAEYCKAAPTRATGFTSIISTRSG